MILLHHPATYAQQAEDNPLEHGSGLWVARLSGEEQAALAATAFLQFAVTKPTAAQWEAAHQRLFGSELCAVGDY